MIARLSTLIVSVIGASLVLSACGGGSDQTTATETQAGATARKQSKAAGKGEATTEKSTGEHQGKTGTGKQGTTTAERKTTTAGEETAAGKDRGRERSTEPKGGPREGPLLAEGKQLFAAIGCGKCHTLATAGSNGTTGPNLDEALSGKSAAFIRESIVDPDARIAPGYRAGVMPSNLGPLLGSSELRALVSLLQQGAGG